MQNPGIAQLISEADSVYSLVVAVARRSRDIAQEALEDGIELDDKPLNIAIDEFSQHRCRVRLHSDDE